MPWAIVAPVLAITGMVATLAQAGRVPTGDATHLAAMTFEVSSLIRQGDLAGALGTWATRVSPQPPLGYVPGVLASLFIADDWLAVLLTGAFALALVWDALRRLAGGRAPWGPALVVLASPMVWLYVEQYGWDLLTGAAVLQAVSWLHRSDGLRVPHAALAFGAWMGVGFLTKYTFGMYLWLPCLVVGIGIVRGRDRARWKNLGRAVAIFLVLVGPWLAINHAALADYLGRSVGAGAEAAVQGARSGAGRFSADSLALYPLALKDALGWPGVAALLFVGIGGVLSRRGAGPGRPARGGAIVLPVLAACGGLLVLSSLEQSQDRYALPALLALSTLALPLGRLVWGQEVFVGVFLAQLLASIATFRPGAPTGPPRFDHGLASAAALSWPGSRTYTPTHVDLAAWRVDEALTRATTFATGRPLSLLLPDDPRLPEPGVYLLRARVLGLEGALDVRRPRGAAPPRDGWPGPEPGAVYAVWTPGVDTAMEAWIAGSGRVSMASLALPGGVSGVILR